MIDMFIIRLYGVQMSEPTYELDKQPRLHEVADSIINQFETDGSVDASQVSAFIDTALLQLRTASGVHVYHSGFTPAAIPYHLEGVHVIEP